MRIGPAALAKTVAAASMVGLAVLYAAALRHETPPPREPPQGNAATDRTQPSSAVRRSDADAACGERGKLTVPVRGVGSGELADTFNDARAAGRRHDAIDIMSPLGTPVVAAAAGRVEKLFFSEAGGNTVYVRSPDRRIIYYYAHLARYAPSLREGQALEQGSPVGFVGVSGNADPAAPHLHFAVMSTSPDRKWWEAAAALNPHPLLTGRAALPPCNVRQIR